MLIDGLEGFFETAARFDIQLLYGLFRISNRVEQILALGVQEVVTLLRFLKFLESLRIYGTQRLDARPDLLRALLDLAYADFVERSFLDGGQLRGGNVQIPTAGLVQIPQVTLLADQLYFDRVPALLSRLGIRPQRTQRFIERCQRSSP